MYPSVRPIAAIRLPCHSYGVTVHTKSELERLSRAARREFPHALMSDTKWRKLFGLLAAAELELTQLRVKFIEVSQPRMMDPPALGAQNLPQPYIDTIEFGPVELRAIEWLEIPAVARFPRPDNVPPREVAQDIDRVEAHLASSGSYPIHRSDENLRIIGYSRDGMVPR